MNLLKISKFFLYLVPLAVIIVVPSTLFPFIVGKYVFFRTAVGLALIFYLLGLFFKRIPFPKIETFKSPLVLAVLIFVLVFLLSGFLGVDPGMSFWSNFERGEGSLQILCLGVFFLLAFLLFEKSDWQKMFWISIIAAVLMVFYGIAAGLKYVDGETEIRNIDGVPTKMLTGQGGPFFQTFKNFIGSDFRDDNYRFAGSIGNPAYVAVYLVFILFYVFYLFMDKYRHRLLSAKTIILGAATILFLVFFVLSATRGAFLGLIVAVIAAFFYLAFSIKSWRKWLLMIGVTLLLIIGSLVLFRNTSFVKSIPGSRIFDISLQTENLQNRLVIWEMAFDGFKERPVLGWGPENFPYVFDKHYNPEHYSVRTGFGAWYDRAHSVFLDYLISSGILGLFGYLSIFVVFYWLIFKKLQTESKSGLITNSLMFVLPVAYLVQGMVLFDILPTYINLFLFLAFAAYKLGISNK